ncbi:hypothetical protein BDZ90DRAFT_234299 [Jaminaea rosea]|uniref:Uncharacterized protein n=1 Tax=Jaminaea rosea TaxID=1569628 RepID=A0A316UIN2_9BASI|nr:hypothetical protein BDZ90DRAFT_234299 [Jaminaea rosea]PWN25080.1 hypothetical protein BDZ90DRAFT_234299 [Jaminaea rosea]
MTNPNPTKRPFNPTLSAAEAFPPPSTFSSYSTGSPNTTFSRTDSRLSCQMASRPSSDVLAGLQSVGMRARMAVERGYDGSNGGRAGTPPSGAAVLPPRATWGRTQSMPTWGMAQQQQGARELQPFGEGNAWPSAVEYATIRHQNRSDDLMEEDGASVAASSSSSLKRTADDVLGDAFGDEEGDFVDEEQENVDLAAGPGSMAPPPAPRRTIAPTPARLAPRANPFAQGASTTHTMPANLATAEYLRAGADGANEPWASMRFDDFAKKEDF